MGDSMDKNKKMTAAISGVMAYLKDERTDPSSRNATDRNASQRNAWGSNGRQAQMQMRTMMVMKAFHRT